MATQVGVEISSPNATSHLSSDQSRIAYVITLLLGMALVWATAIWHAGEP